MLTVSQLRKSFGQNTVLDDVSFSLKDGEVVGLVGPSGSGKSVLLKVLGGVLRADSGRIGKTNAHSAGDRAGSGGVGGDVAVGFLFQEGGLFDSMSVVQNVAFPLLSEPSFGQESHSFGSFRREPLTQQEAMERAVEILKEVGLSKAWNKVPGQLSGGMRKRVGIARALVAKPSLVLLDDPTGGLDPVAASVIMNLIEELHKHYSPTIIIVSHDIRRLFPSVSRVLGLFSGRIVCDECTADVRSNAPEQVVSFLATRYDFEQVGS